MNHLRLNALAALVLTGLGILPAQAATYRFQHFVPGMTAVSAAVELAMSLATGSLPAGEVNLAYSYDLNQLLSVTGDTSYNPSNVSWTVSTGNLPPGLTLGGNGVVSGTPTAKNTTGTNFEVLATYKTKSGRQAYTIVVNGVVLRVTQIAGGNGFSCALSTTGGAMCWGANNSGQLGNGTMTFGSKPSNVSGLTSGATWIATGSAHACAVTAGSVKCWGSNTTNQLGYSGSNSSTPVAVSGLTGVASVSGGAGHSCAVTTAGAGYCWGQNTNGQLGNNSTTNSVGPVAVSSLGSGVASIKAGGAHSCAVTTAGALQCWGDNSKGQLGTGTKTGSTVPVGVSGLASGVSDVALGSYHTCVAAGAAMCWGYNAYGQLGDGTKVDKLVPTVASGLGTGVSTVASALYSSCAATGSGAAYCWGYNSSGQLGDGTTVDKSVPTVVSGLTSGITAITLGNSHACAIATENRAMCWGTSNGMGAPSSSTIPVGVSP